MAVYRKASLWNSIWASLSRKAVATQHDDKYQPTEAEMMDVIRTFMGDSASLAAARGTYPRFDSFSVKEKYSAAVSIRPDLDVAERKMKEQVHELPGEPYSGFVSEYGADVDAVSL